MNYVPWIISFLSLCVCVLTYVRNGNKDMKADVKEEDQKLSGIKESLLKANMKLDQVCSTTSETRVDIKSLNKDLQNMDRRVTIIEHDVKTAFEAIDELKGKVGEKHEFEG